MAKQIEINGKKISYIFDGYVDRDVNELDIENIEQIMEEGYSEGEIASFDSNNPEDIYYGEWKVL